ncbi:uncharacterized protein F5147DRAFT_656908 [Suillus discolor]|uniref:Uncharacterized protein n=1 Tax=Suillus discolor TaxID=1912936 RepID=A0A9P7JP98_9AGAM|nr:uncharacterized protein F5147DRAFT_658033 [Suillus discolor]XP_041287772.1 uncharacterized protein F5147DRAFT_656908 [Suillus discolor]KAG2091046.1 hypothetical protein F5147DRAFT_658033 [Suillus discolor]KAG2095257.1 hypothetical protein F5147DRAFT_656908 [Suillus discolor]
MHGSEARENADARKVQERARVVSGWKVTKVSAPKRGHAEPKRYRVEMEMYALEGLVDSGWMLLDGWCYKALKRGNAYIFKLMTKTEDFARHDGAMDGTCTVIYDRLKHVYVDGLINGVDIRRFTDDFSAQAKAQTTVASVIMAVNASILAVPGLGTQLAMKALCSISFILCVYSIIGCAIAQQLVQSLRYLDFSAYYLQEEMGTFVILSLAFAIIGVLAGIFTVEFGLPLSERIGCGLILVVGGGLMIPLTMASFGPGLIQ